MRNIIILLTLVLLSQEVCAQLQVLDADEGLKGVCTPGIKNKSRSRGLEISFTSIGGGNINNVEGSNYVPDGIESIQQLNFKLKIPLIYKPGFSLLIGLSHRPETYFFEDANLIKASSVFNDVHAGRLKSSGIGAYAIKSINSSQYTIFRVKFDYNGDYDQFINFDRRYRAIGATWAYGYKINDDFEWGFGLTFNSNFRRTLALPYIFYNRNFSEKWGIEAIFPGYADLRYNIDQKTILMGGYKFNSRNYSIDLATASHPDTEGIFHLNHSELQFGLSLERNIAPWVWLNVKGGFQRNFNTRLEAQSEEFSSYKIKPPHAPYFSLGLFLSPPNK